MSNKVLSVQPLSFPWKTADPFLFCVHHVDFYPNGNDHFGPDAPLTGRNLGNDFTIKDGWRMYHGERVPGFPAHPHCGFETVTIVTKGLVDHSDSLGAAGRFGFGDVQWMTAGKGVQHSEMFPLLNQAKENPLELFQIWLNLPKKSKKAEPHFSMLWSETIPQLQTVDAAGRKIAISIMAGELQGHKAPSPPPDSWASDPANDVAIFLIKMEAGANWTLLAASAGINRTLYFYEGDSLTVDGQVVKNYHSVSLNSAVETQIQNGAKAASVLVLQGRPINEPVVQYGPFVGNTQQDIQEAYHEFQRTQFGGWPWPGYDNVHPRERGRFALHANGVEEVK